ncbi:hypothetical protein J32TS6_18960 [Virgibacillus pantothenticus]|uniref:hypothetical protein n=1 Tax=Virgibacillus pantothenticus TaxID=1473 RepID=UPI001B2D739B|nr:hypothetical protein [Virgibacillus pantothenticus]GIP63341.1 hypothetical protein J32TS6_18960 [Virgibacillus pantothenticus]
MSKERLEEFKDYIDYLDDSLDMQDNGRFVDALHSLYEDGWLDWVYKYAKKQAKRVQELENTIKAHDHSKNLNAMVAGENVNLKIENQRYKQALEFYADKQNYREMVDQSGVETLIEEDNGRIARRALKGESE